MAPPQEKLSSPSLSPNQFFYLTGDPPPPPSRICVAPPPSPTSPPSPTPPHTQSAPSHEYPPSKRVGEPLLFFSLTARQRTLLPSSLSLKDDPSGGCLLHPPPPSFHPAFLPAHPQTHPSPLFFWLVENFLCMHKIPLPLSFPSPFASSPCSLSSPFLQPIVLAGSIHFFEYRQPPTPLRSRIGRGRKRMEVEDKKKRGRGGNFLPLYKFSNFILSSLSFPPFSVPPLPFSRLFPRFQLAFRASPLPCLLLLHSFPKDLLRLSLQFYSATT